MLVKHFFTGKIAHSSYILAGRKTCAVVDPDRDAEMYIAEARALGVEITHVLLTHLHADFISGHSELAEGCGAAVYVARSAECAFDHIPLSEGDRVTIEDMTVDVLETPGHTPEHLCLVVTDRARSDSPVGVFTGDALFVGDVGRPDLFPGRAEELARKLHRSLHGKLMTLPEYCEVYPTHGAGSLCGRFIGSKWTSTVGYERAWNGALAIGDEEAFVRSLTENMPPAPDHFSRCSDVNRRGPALVASLPRVEELSPKRFRERADRPGTEVVDSRSYHAFGSQHVHGAWSLDLGGNFPTFAGWVLPPERDVLLVADDYEKALQAAAWCRRVGVDRVVGCLSGGMAAWAMAGLESDAVAQISAEELHRRVTSSSDFVLLDVRMPGEFRGGHIDGAINIPVSELRTRYGELDRDRPTVLLCSSGNRSSLGTSILKRHGFSNLFNVAGGMTGYSAAGYAKECPVCVLPHASRFFTGPGAQPVRE
ncbi:MAG TPA: MBL fold metallo-hydrolase [Synergistaceae bacterium]|nr:MBL fold metallo-hydrolase [Synergistaceae bacterium]